MTISPEEIQKIIANNYAAVQALDLEAWIAIFDENAVSYDPVGSSPVKGHAALSKFFQEMFGQFKEVQLVANHIFVCGDEVAVKWTGNGVSKNDRKFAVEGIDVFHINTKGKIQTLLAYWNPETLIAQLQN